MKDDKNIGLFKQRILINTVSNYIGRVINLAVWVILTPFILLNLGTTTYGLWVLVGSVVAYGALLDFGIAGAITKYVAEYHAKNQLGEAKSLVATALVLYIFFGLLVTLGGFLFAPIFPSIFNVPPNQSETAILLVMLSGFNMGLAIMSASTTAVLRGMQRFDLMNILGIVSTLLSAGATVLVLLRGGGVIDIVIVSIVVIFVMQIPAIYLIYKIAPELRFGLASPNRRMLRKVSSFSSSLFLIHVGGQLETKTDEIVIGAFLPVSAVTPYNLARKISTLPQIFSEQFLSLLLPMASGLHAKNDQTRLRSLYIVSTRLTMGTFLAFSISIVILAGPILTVWVGEEFAQYAYLVFILTLASFIDIPTWPAGFVLQGMARHRFNAIMAFCSGIANLALSLILVRHLGITGVALGTLIPTTIFSLGFVMPYAIRVIGVTIREMYKEVIIPTFVPIVPAGITAYLLKEFFEPSTIFPTLVIAAIGSFIYLAIYLKSSRCKFERSILQDAKSMIKNNIRNLRVGFKEIR
jgi:O-antigen/teichoic acid export membrane protein